VLGNQFVGRVDQFSYQGMREFSDDLERLSPAIGQLRFAAGDQGLRQHDDTIEVLPWRKLDLFFFRSPLSKQRSRFQ